MPSSYTIGDHFENFVREQVEGGSYASASEVIRKGCDFWKKISSVARQ